PDRIVDEHRADLARAIIHEQRNAGLSHSYVEDTEIEYGVRVLATRCCGLPLRGAGPRVELLARTECGVDDVRAHAVEGNAEPVAHRQRATDRSARSVGVRGHGVRGVPLDPIGLVRIREAI